MKEIIEDKVKQIVDKKVKEHFSIEDVDGNESEDVNLDKTYKDKELITSIEKDYQDFADEDLDIHESLIKEIIEDKVKEIVDKKVKEHFSIEDVDGNESEDVNLDKNYKDKELITSIEKDDQDFADEDLDFHESLMKEIIEDKVKQIVDKKVKEHFSIEDVDGNESEDVNLDKTYKDKELITSIEKDYQDFADEDLDIHESLIKEIIEDKVKEIVDKKVKEHFSIEDVDGNESEDVNWYVNMPVHYSTGKRYLEDIEVDGQSNKKKQDDEYVPLYRGQHQPQDILEESDLKQTFKDKMGDITENKNTPDELSNIFSKQRKNKEIRVDGLEEGEISISTDFTTDEKHPLMHEKDNNKILIAKSHQKKDEKNSITDRIIIEEKQLIPPNEEEKNDYINENLYQTENKKDSIQKRRHKEKEMIPMRVIDGSIGKIDSFKTQKKKDRWDGPHPFRSICRLLKCLNI